MIILTLADGEDNEEEDIFINPMHIVAIIINDEMNATDVVCVDQTVFTVKESPLTVYNLINKQFN